ncbi:hypothetical protein DFH07DRAFT_158656 [Mycena maculata]|uniref:Uncharacterized protein n=1 Tax=Mycena maculata TaxID=230809 RepID=A0AAD7HYX8_9AGAR|nr:hypothetical protein DFH07DRAFT_158656 [Mycena maculata]
MSRSLPPHWQHAGPDIVNRLAQMAHEAPPKASPRLGRKGFLYLQKTVQTVKAEEQMRITARRILKAERDERIDITRALTPSKQYMAGFTRPRDLRTSNWFPGGAYIAQSKKYESPLEEAYEPHTVFLLESRYHIRFGVGRVEAPHYVYGVCREQDLPAVLKQYNSPNPPHGLLTFMDNARWPGGPQLKGRSQVKWWNNYEDLQTTLKELGSTANPTKVFVEASDEADENEPEQAKSGKKKQPQRVTGLNPIRLSTIRHSGDHSSPPVPPSAHAFHSSSILSVGHSYNDDHVVPDFYVQRKQSKANKELEDEESPVVEPPTLQDTPSLMEHLSDGILSDEIVASTLRLASKIPMQSSNEDGVLVHPSGFVIPTPADYTFPERKQRERDLAQQTAAVAKRVLEEEDLVDVSAETSSRHGKVPFEVRHEDGTVSHPSGFKPPTAADDFEHSANTTVDSHIGQQPLVLGSTPGAKRGFHTAAIARAQEVEWDFERARQQSPNEEFVHREKYMSTLESKPFWRPLLTLTVSTRPLATSLVRLARGGSTGTPFHVFIDNDDRKCRISCVNRMRVLRLRRLQNLTVQLGQVLAGSRGGVVGIRFEPDSMGRGIGGEGLEAPIPWDKRHIGVGVGNWYHMAPELKELFSAVGREEIPSSGGRDALDVFGVDEFGQRISSDGAVVPWTPRPQTSVDKWMREPWYTEYCILRSTLKGIVAAQREMSKWASVKAGKPNVKESAPTGRPAPSKEAREDAEDSDADEDELDLREDEEGDTPAISASSPAFPTVLIRENAWLDMSRVLEENGDEEELEAPLNFVLMSPSGKPLLGPRDEAGKILLEGMTFPLQPHIARQVLQRRMDMYYRAKTLVIASIFAARHAKVDYPRPLFETKSTPQLTK